LIRCESGFAISPESLHIEGVLFCFACTCMRWFFLFLQKSPTRES
jgi:hypothetical protein